MELDTWAADEALRLLGNLGDRWKHVQGVAQLAREISRSMSPQEGAVLRAAAYLHDVGYSPALRETGAHQLDGARHLRRLGFERLAALIAHHSAADIEIRARGLGDELASYEREDSPVADALAYCDTLTGPKGSRVSLEQRVAEVEQRYGPGLVADSLRQAVPELRRSIERTEELLARAS